MNNEFLFYGHGGSENHGCEAIIRSSVDILTREFGDISASLLKQDSNIGIDGKIGLPVDEIILQRKISKYSIDFVLSGLSYLLTRKSDPYFDAVYSNLHAFINDKTPIVLSIGGDNYCYGHHQSLYYLDKFFRKRNCKKILWGCSIEPSVLNDKSLVNDLDDFDLIIGRESITVDSLRNVLKRAAVVLRPDPAFALQTIIEPLPAEFIQNGVVGINISPVVNNVRDGKNIIYENYDKMIRHILNNTQYSVLLVPHVVWKKNDDLAPLTDLYEMYSSSGRVKLIPDNDCRKLKGYIAQCDLFIGARTHSTIAAYSNCVPCVVVGYSVKAKGIAVDLFGTTDNYVISSQSVVDADTLTNAFSWLDRNKKDIRNHLEQFIPSYIEQAQHAASDIKAILK